MIKLVFATGNMNKLREIKEILSGLDVEILSMKEAGVDIDIVEDGKTFDFSYPLTKTAVSALNIGNSELEVKWTPVKEAEGYVLTYTDNSGKKISQPLTKALEAVITDLKDGVYSDISVAAVRGSESLSSAIAISFL